MKNSGFTLRKRALSFKYAFHGIFLLISREHNAWIHCFAAVCVITAGILVGLSSMEWIVICLCIGLVLSAEAVNSAIEALADRVSPAYDEAIKRTKEEKASVSVWPHRLVRSWLMYCIFLMNRASVCINGIISG